MHKTLITLALCGALAPPAYAGGLFGDGGLIGGDVGEFFDKNVEKPITTPLAQAARKGVVVGAGAKCVGLTTASGAGTAAAGIVGMACVEAANKTLPR